MCASLSDSETNCGESDSFLLRLSHLLVVLKINMSRVINIHADDYGVSDEISDKILDSIQHGAINSISILTTTDSFERNMKKLVNVDHVRLSLHLNLVEGFPAAPKALIPDITNEDGEFKFSFLPLWIKYFLSSKKDKEKLKEQIKMEVEHQIKKYISHLDKGVPLRVDSHMHFHMIPFIFDVLVELSMKYKIKFIRLPYELRYYSKDTFKNYFSSNIIKNVLLNGLVNLQSSKLISRNIESNEFFIGVLSTGNCTYQDMSAALKKISLKNNPNSIDVLFHPGGVANSNSVTWTNKKIFQAYYSSKDREKERKMLKELKTKKTLEHYEALFNNG